MIYPVSVMSATPSACLLTSNGMPLVLGCFATSVFGSFTIAFGSVKSPNDCPSASLNDIPLWGLAKLANFPIIGFATLAYFLKVCRSGMGSVCRVGLPPVVIPQ